MAVQQALVSDELLKEFSKEQLQQVDAIIATYFGNPGSLIPVLEEVQGVLGYLPNEIQRRIAQGLNLPQSPLSKVNFPPRRPPSLKNHPKKKSSPSRFQSQQKPKFSSTRLSTKLSGATRGLSLRAGDSRRIKMIIRKISSWFPCDPIRSGRTLSPY